MAWGWRIDLVGPIDCVRLSLHGGSLLAGVRPRLVTTRLPRAVRSRRSQISTISGTSPGKPNVLYEAGFAHALGKPTVHICSTPLSALPFDVRNWNTIAY